MTFCCFGFSQVSRQIPIMISIIFVACTCIIFNFAYGELVPGNQVNFKTKAGYKYVGDPMVNIQDLLKAIHLYGLNFGSGNKNNLFELKTLPKTHIKQNNPII